MDNKKIDEKTVRLGDVLSIALYLQIDPDDVCELAAIDPLWLKGNLDREYRIKAERFSREMISLMLDTINLVLDIESAPKVILDQLGKQIGNYADTEIVRAGFYISGLHNKYRILSCRDK